MDASANKDVPWALSYTWMNVLQRVNGRTELKFVLVRKFKALHGFL